MGGSGGVGGAGGAASEPLTTVFVTQRDGSPADGVNVVAHDPDGLLVDEGATGADGSAQVHVPVGGGVTVAWITEEVGVSTLGRVRLARSVLGLQSPEEVRFVLNRRGVVQYAAPVTLQIAGTIPDGAAAVLVSATCGSLFQPAGVEDNFSAVVELLACPGENKMDVVVTAYDASQSAISQAKYLNLSAVGGTSVNILSQAAHFEPLDAGMFQISGPAGYESISVSTSSLTAEGLVRSTGLNAVASGSIVDAVDPAPGDSYSVVQALDYEGYVRFHQQAASALPMGGGFDALPLDAITLPSADVTSAARPTISWTVEGSGELGDGVMVTYDWSLTEPDTSRSLGRWRLFLPPDRTSVTLPELPEALQAHRPTAEDTSLVVSRLDDAEATTPAGLLAYELLDDVQGVQAR